MKQFSNIEIKDVIKKRYPLDRLSFHFDIPMKRLIALQQEVEAEQEALRKMNKIKKTYSKLYDSKPKEDEKSKEIDMDGCWKTIETIKESLNEKREFKKGERNRLITKLVKAMEMVLQQTDDIETLEKLSRKITIGMMQEFQMQIGTLQNRITEKIHSMKKRETLSKLNDDVSPEIKGIIDMLATGKVELDYAIRIINQEAEERKTKKRDNKFALSREQERKQILIQIRKKFEDGKFKINNPEEFIINLQEIGETDINGILVAVVGNLICFNEYDTAERICHKYESDDQNSTRSTNIINLRNKIRHAQIGQMILNALEDGASDEEKIQAYNRIMKGLRLRTINLSQVPLGLSKDGQTRINLCNIWEEANFIEK